MPEMHLRQPGYDGDQRDIFSMVLKVLLQLLQCFKRYCFNNFFDKKTSGSVI